VGVSITELTVIFLVALVLFGPEQLPVLARTLGKLTGQVKKTSDSLRREFYNSVYPPGQDVRNALNGELQTLRNLKAEILAPPPGAVGSSSRASTSEHAVAQPSQPSTPHEVVPPTDSPRVENA
jgi:TatA/E family protein of Tat protein translocase